MVEGREHAFLHAGLEAIVASILGCIEKSNHGRGLPGSSERAAVREELP